MSASTTEALQCLQEGCRLRWDWSSRPAACATDGVSGPAAKWNKVYNLTAVRDPQEMLTHHLLDSLAAVPPCAAIWRSWRKVVRCRAGVRLLMWAPAVACPVWWFAICCPELDVSCVDTVGKESRLHPASGGGLKLRNLHGLHARVETLTETFDVVSCRAFASPPDFVVVAFCTGCTHGVAGH